MLPWTIFSIGKARGQTKDSKVVQMYVILVLFTSKAYRISDSKVSQDKGKGFGNRRRGPWM